MPTSIAGQHDHGKVSGGNKRDDTGAQTLSIVRSALLSIVASFVVVLVAALVVIPRVTGSESYTILTSSMEPGFPPGTVIVTQPRPVANIVVGDVITYQLASGKPEVVTHRVVGIRSDTQGDIAFTTRGDNNSINDPHPVIERQVKGVLIYSVPFVGMVLNQVSGNVGLWAPVAGGILLLVVGGSYVISHFSRTGASQKSSRSRRVSGEPHA
ncbi:signal peptidase I [Leucobacter coleopterorum]|uniref:Signal peptidase I n=1 Tax=Leucobacter coleopterorum TaxID=2714933 RepID=A0ABX6JWN8_9MICO|nr:signal peptidase I [Leucobacter coleopterorum]QIM18714.1 signal peptidase I [Leucobacter coleopterorum]